MKTGISVIVCCHNSVTRIGPTLAHLLQQELASGYPCEIVLVDNACTDNTVAEAQRVWCEKAMPPYPLRIIQEPIPGLTHARWAGIRSAEFDLLVFCDDDNWLDKRYLSAAIQFMQLYPTVGALGGTGTAVGEIPLPDWFDQYKTMYACYPQGEREGILKAITASLYGAGMVIRRSALEELAKAKHRFLLSDRVSEKLVSGGDTEISLALRLMGYHLAWSDKLKFFHFMSSPRLTTDYLIRLNRSLAWSSGQLLLYRYALEGKEMTRMVWAKDTLYRIFALAKCAFRSLTRNGTSMERSLDWTFSNEILKSILGQVGGYRSRFHDIQRLKGLRERSVV